MKLKAVVLMFLFAFATGMVGLAQGDQEMETKKATFTIKESGMCQTVESVLQEEEGIVTMKSVAENQVEVNYNPNQINLEKINKKLSDAGYKTEEGEDVEGLEEAFDEEAQEIALLCEKPERKHKKGEEGGQK